MACSFDFFNSPTTASGVKRCYASGLDISGYSLKRLYGNVFVDLMIPNVSLAGITWPLTGSDDPVCLGWISFGNQFYVFKNVIVYNETSNTWRISGIVQQASQNDSI